jgi:hypothetical protein
MLGAMIEHRFRIGDVFDAEDEVAVYLVNVAMGFNDIVYAVSKGSGEGIEEWERFYWARLFAAHFHEAMDYVKRRSTQVVIRSFVERLAPATQAHYLAALEQYAALETRLGQVRSRTVFHYETGGSAKHVKAAIRRNADATGFIRSGADGSLFGSRNVFADTVLSSLLVGAAGGNGEAVSQLVSELLDAVQEFMRFVNGALDEWLVEHRDAVTTDSPPS